ncbi:MAG: calcium/sodium antiporter [Candidatus Marinimicrobia bacterium]|nr:calcium/sodium antiporter [Candidatus Neomarinimicrobiota bacterium]
MNDLVLNIILFSIGIFTLYYGADFLVRGGANIARLLKIKPMVIGLTIVAFGTSMPEFLVGISAVLKNEDAIAVGNIVGSNIANIALILGFSAIVSPILIRYKHIKNELLFLLISTIIFIIFMINGVALYEGIIFLIIIFSYTVFLLRNPGTHPVSEDMPEKDDSLLKNIFFVLLGFLGLVLGSNFLVDSAVFIARIFGVSEIVIGMSIVAVGTSLPELAASAVASLKKQTDISIGNIIGSNIFNMFFVAGGISLIKPIPVDNKIFFFEIPVMFLYVLLLFPIILISGGIKRWQGILLLISYFIFNIYLYYAR